MQTELKAAVETVEKLNETIQGRFNGLEREILAIKRSGRVTGDLGGELGAEAKAMGAYFRNGETKALSVTSDGQGVSVRSDWNDRIFALVRESSPMRAVASVIATSKNEIEVLVDREEPASDWIGETGVRAGTAASFMTRHKIAVSEHYALPSATLDMLDDSDFPVEQWLQGKIADRFARQEAAAFINGDGVGQPRGILDYDLVPDDEFAWGADPANYAIGAIYTGAAGALPAMPAGADPLADLVDALKAPYLPGASWMMTRAMRNRIRKLKDADGRFIYQASLDAAIPDRLMGYPVNLAEDMPALADGAVGALFGDFRQAYTIADRIGLAVIRDQLTQPGFVRWYVRRRVGGALTNPEAVKALVLGVKPAGE
ncbi:phage major capsid protein [Phaeovulum veldkampii]|uniref:Phage major capsid protein n=1 Tax=Phaeovulum veldkampii DSM 11550 TaxID=1185920 RepID=A0A2T4JJI0_9RHOB|nr:phage major capsid protein [Phaeovulum veldkampii]PTE18071.1 phage major capsid protein [Phaeovulum veldkampii DSM 11550]TDQ57126.1 HK97 family phage major capsid protein [Phaeovulum veldkampii DSM 11550]